MCNSSASDEGVVIVRQHREITPVVQIAILTCVLVIGGFCFQGNVGLNLGDEGYLWHNVQRTFEGAVPIRDFRSYDPGRYYWGALWFHLMSPGLFSLRVALSVFQALGLFMGLCAVRRVISHRWILILAGMLLMLWMYPRHKIFESCFSMSAVLIAVRLIENPTGRRHLCAGLLVGVAAFWGRNLGVYFFLGFLFLISFLASVHPKKHIVLGYGIWGAGILIGYFPMIAMWMAVPGFFHYFIDSVFKIFSPYAPVESLAIPWPWHRSLFMLSRQVALDQFLLGVAYVGVFAFYLISAMVIWINRDKRGSPLFVASIFIGIPLLHHICGRADFAHFAQGVHPVLVALMGCYGIVSGYRHRTVLHVAITGLLCGLSVLLVISSQEIMMSRERLKSLMGEKSDLVVYSLQDREFWLHRAQVQYIRGLQKCLNDHQMSLDENILLAPFAPGIYPLLKKNAPIWDPFPIHRAPLSGQEQSIMDIESKNVRWALISNAPLDGIESRRFSHTHNILWQYLLKNFERIECSILPDEQILLRAKPSAGAISDSEYPDGFFLCRSPVAVLVP